MHYVKRLGSLHVETNRIPTTVSLIMFVIIDFRDGEVMFGDLFIHILVGLGPSIERLIDVVFQACTSNGVRMTARIPAKRISHFHLPQSLAGLAS